MRAAGWLRRLFQPIARIGEMPGESEARRGGRRVFLVAFVIATAFTLPTIAIDLQAGYTWVGISNAITTVAPALILVAM